MRLSQLLDIAPGVTAAIGSGGKTSLLRALAAELPGTVILCTTTHIFPFEEAPLVTDGGADAVAAALRQSRVVCVGTSNGGKLTAPALPFAALRGLADYVLVEADGSRRLPLKAHAPWEPVIPPECGRVVCLVGASGFGRPVAEAAHRPERFAELGGLAMTDAATPEAAARVVNAERWADVVFVNQADTAEELALARRFAAVSLPPVLAGSLRRGEYRDLR